jgi:hypothetical protein
VALGADVVEASCFISALKRVASLLDPSARQRAFCVRWSRCLLAWQCSLRSLKLRVFSSCSCFRFPQHVCVVLRPDYGTNLRWLAENCNLRCRHVSHFLSWRTDVFALVLTVLSTLALNFEFACHSTALGAVRSHETRYLPSKLIVAGQGVDAPSDGEFCFAACRVANLVV